MDARRTWAAPPGSRSAEAPRSSHLEALRARWRVLAAELRRLAAAEGVLERAPRRPAPARGEAVAQRSHLEIRRRRYEHGLYFLVSGQLNAVTGRELERRCERMDPEAIDTVVLDLGEVTSMDSGGLRALFASFAHLGERLVIIVSAPCAHTIHIAKVRDRLPIIEG